MQVVIIAAGQGRRLSSVSDSKPLTPVVDVPLLERVIDTARGAGATGFVVVTGFNADRIETFLEGLSCRLQVPLALVHNERWDLENGLSVLRARGLVREPFLLAMADHLFDEGIMRRLIEFPVGAGETVLAVDRRVDNHPLVDMDDVTRVLEEGGRLRAIGKTLEKFNAFDTGLFLCTHALFDALQESAHSGDSTLSGGMRCLAAKNLARTMDIGDAFWLDVDDENALAQAELHFAQLTLRP